MDAALEAFYKPYHEFLDVLFRMAVNLNQFSEPLINLSCLCGVEGASLHFNLFPKFWVGIYNNKTTNRYTEFLVKNSIVGNYIDLILKNERVSLNDQIIASFVEIYYPKIISRLSVPRLIEAICQIVTNKNNLLDICADLFTIRIIAQRNGVPPSVKMLLQKCLRHILLEHKDEFSSGSDESPPKKRKINLTPTKVLPDTDKIEKVKVSKLSKLESDLQIDDDEDEEENDDGEDEDEDEEEDTDEIVVSKTAVVKEVISEDLAPSETVTIDESSKSDTKVNIEDSKDVSIEEEEMVKKEDDIQTDNDKNENEMKQSTTSPAVSDDRSANSSNKNSLERNIIKEIERHIEVIFECLDFDDDDEDGEEEEEIEDVEVDEENNLNMAKIENNGQTPDKQK